MRWLGILAIVFACGCKFDPQPAAPAEAGVFEDAGRDDAAIDAAADAAIDASACNTVQCSDNHGTCNGGTCEIVADQLGAVTCPPAPTECAVSCPADNKSCLAAMTCPTNASCAFRCDGDHTCFVPAVLTCAPGSTCEIFCKGNHACDNFTVECTNATCNYHCCGAQSCINIACVGGCTEGASTCP